MTAGRTSAAGETVAARGRGAGRSPHSARTCPGRRQLPGPRILQLRRCPGLPSHRVFQKVSCWQREVLLLCPKPCPVSLCQNHCRSNGTAHSSSTIFLEESADQFLFNLTESEVHIQVKHLCDLRMSRTGQWLPAEACHMPPAAQQPE